MLGPEDPDPNASTRFRATARVIIVDEFGRILLFLHYGKSREVPPRWITPGGGVDPGESWSEAAVRELREETGIDSADVPEPFLVEDFAPDQRWHPYQRGRWAWFWVPVRHTAVSVEGWTDEERADIVEWRWWNVAELAASEFEVEPAQLIDWVREREKLKP